MKTDALIGALAKGAGPAPQGVIARRLAPAVLLGLGLSAVLAVVIIGLVPARLFHNPLWWVKFSYSLLLALACGWLAARLARPVARLKLPRRAVAGVLVVMLLLGASQLMLAAPEWRMKLFMGSSASTCPWNILMLSIPALGFVLWAMRGLAPTRTAWAGLAAGLLAGALGAAGYALSCAETSMAFVATWYTLGIMMTGALGALLGPRLLRW